MFIYCTLMKKILSLCTFLSLFVVSCNPVQDAAVLDPRYFVAENKTVDMTMEEIFNDRQMFKNTIIKGVQEELDQFGLQVQNANIKELQDTEDSKYFR